MEGQNNQNVRLLIAEDHPSLARSMAEGLREEGYDVDLALDGLDAERFINSNQYSCVILDLILPGKDGLALLKEMRQRGDQSPVMCVTARDALDDRVAGLDLGADDYLVKPFAWDELLARVRALIRRAHGVAWREPDPPDGARVHVAAIPRGARRAGGVAIGDLQASVRAGRRGVEQCRRRLHR